jgi:hypothetical protein
MKDEICAIRNRFKGFIQHFRHHIQHRTVIIGHPLLVRPSSLKVALQKIGRNFAHFTVVGFVFFYVYATDDAMLTHQPLDGLKEVNWDGNTQTVYIGKKPDNSEKSVAIDTLKVFKAYGDSSRFITGSDAKFVTLDEEISPFNRLVTATGKNNVFPSGNVVYKLDSNYSCIHGSFVAYGFELGTTGTHKLNFYNVDQYGTETLIKGYEVNNGDQPIDVDINLRGCNFVKIEMNGDYTQGRSEPFQTPSVYKKGSPAFYDVTLTTAN